MPRRNKAARIEHIRRKIKRQWLRDSGKDEMPLIRFTDGWVRSVNWSEFFGRHHKYGWRSLYHEILYRLP